MSQLANYPDNITPSNKKRRLCYHNPLLETMNSLSGPPRINAWRSVSSQLESLDSLDEHDLLNALVPIHNTLLIHVGYTLAMETSQQEVLYVLCTCWRQIIQRIPSAATCDGVNLLSQILEKHRDNLCITVHCLEIASILVTSSMMTSLGDSQEKRFLFLVLRLSVVDNPAISQKAASILKLASDNKTRTARIICTAAQIMQAPEKDIPPLTTQGAGLETTLWALGLSVLRNETNEQVEKSLQSIPKRGLLLFLCSLSISSNIALRLSRSEPIIELLYSMARTSDETSKYASYCLSCLAYGGFSLILTEKLVALVCDGTLTVTQKAVPGLYSLLKRKFMLSDHVVGSVISSLAELIFQHEEQDNNTNDDSCIATTRLLTLMATQLGKRSRWTRELATCLSSLAFLLRTSGHDKLARISVDTILELSSNKAFQQPLARQSDLLVSVAHTAANEFSSIQVKCTCIQVLWNLAQEKQNRPILARTSKVLEALVLMVSTGAEETCPTSSRYQACRYALRSLLQLSQVVSNRRILAKRVGLLACLIRFTRSMTVQDEALLLPKEELKEHILQLVILI